MLKRLLPAILTPLMLWLGWPENGITPLLFIAFIPLLFLERELSENKPHKAGRLWFWYNWLSFGLWNLLATSWIANAHWSGLAATVVINGFLMALVMVLFRFIRLKLGNQRGYIALPFLWICLETLHKNWDFSFPWLNLGNGFADRVEWIQWYEYTGAFGGTLWIWTVNLFFFGALFSFVKTKKARTLAWRLSLIILAGILLPVLLSYQRYKNYKEQGEPARVVVVQPNIDSYTEQAFLSDEDQVRKFLRLASVKLDSSTDFLVAPETTMPHGTFIKDLSKSKSIELIRTVQEQYPQLEIVFGASTYKYYEEKKASSTARPLPENGYYDSFNSALFFDNQGKMDIYHKSKLVAGVEKMPFESIIKPTLGKLVDQNGGIMGTLGTQRERSVFRSAAGDLRIGTLICWESDFGEYVTGYVKNGANLLFIITNDDWWGNSAGHIQHLHYARLRAVENRRSIARAANSGISCFINQRGDILQRQEYKKDAVISGSLQANNEMTYYSKAGDLFSRIAVFIAGFLGLFALVRGYLKKVDSQV